MQLEIQGERTGRIWHFHLTIHRLETGGERYRAKAKDDGSLACVHRCERGGYSEDEYDRLRNALAIATLPGVVAAPTIRQLLDVHDCRQAGAQTAFIHSSQRP
jgi:hypothetical protein